MNTNRQSITRLHKYRDTLYRLQQLGLVKVFSDNLAESVGVKAPQVRKDLSALGPNGNKKGGYLIEALIQKLDELLGKNSSQKVIIVGSGNIGAALVNYQGFKDENIRIVAIFDNDLSKVNPKKVIPVLPLEEIKQFIAENEVRLAIIAVPAPAAQEVLDLLVASGIRGALNFAPVRLTAPTDFILNDVDLRLELETVIYYVNAQKRQALDESNNV